MKKPKTKFAGKTNPFTGESTVKKLKHVQVESLVITDDPIQDTRAAVSEKYGEIFSKMKVGQSIKCQPDEAGKIGHALNTWLKRHGIKGMAKTCSRYEADGLGRVWLISAEKSKRGTR
ncbi:MAG: hypothetical protein ACRCWC_11715 [Plesiomonas shigelloides]